MSAYTDFLADEREAHDELINRLCDVTEKLGMLTDRHPADWNFSQKWMRDFAERLEEMHAEAEHMLGEPKGYDPVLNVLAAKPLVALWHQQRMEAAFAAKEAGR